MADECCPAAVQVWPASQLPATQPAPTVNQAELSPAPSRQQEQQATVIPSAPQEPAMEQTEGLALQDSQNAEAVEEPVILQPRADPQVCLRVWHALLLLGTLKISCI